ncbi:tyrosine-type recombinase/integrase [Hyphomicrobium sp. MC8b]|uniref:tyrosine-type recombinase/integrase n=1 Tax=Hyphomicrobium sp. MC8b TaxID=300273 RepID=UPI00391D4F2D
MGRRREDARPLRRRGYWYLSRRVPLEFEAVDKRGTVYVATGIRLADDPRGHRARGVVEKLDAELQRFWELSKAGRNVAVEERYARVRAAAQGMGFLYVEAEEAGSQLPLDNVLKRFETLRRKDKADDADHVAAVLGGVKKPKLMVSGMAAEFERIMAVSIKKKSERQRKKWTVERQSAQARFIEALGEDKVLAELTRADALTLRSFWEGKILAGGIEIETANKYIGRVSSMYRTISDYLQLDLPPIFARLRIPGGVKKRRVAFAPALVQKRVLAEGMFDELNEEARRVIYLVVETGLRLSEACNLNAKTIRLNDPVPHVRVRADEREMKTEQSERDIPLVGVALKAMRAQPDGFPRYRDKADSLSALVNQAMTARGLRGEDGQSLYSLRHTFEDRLTAVEAPEKVTASLMGHKWYRPLYGEGPSLAQKREWLLKIAFKAPRRI